MTDRHPVNIDAGIFDKLTIDGYVVAIEVLRQMQGQHCQHAARSLELFGPDLFGKGLWDEAKEISLEAHELIRRRTPG